MIVSNYKQYDTRWAKLPYPKKPYYIKDCGCGEVAICNCITEAATYKSETPKTILSYCRQYADPNGNGTLWGAIPEMLQHYKMTEVKEHATVEALWKELAKGKRVAVYLMDNTPAGTGIKWTSEKHFVCSTGYKVENGKHWVYVKDSNTDSKKRNGWISYEDNMRGAIFKVWSGKLPKAYKPTGPYKGKLPAGTVKKGSTGTDVKRLKKFLNWCIDAGLNPKNGYAKDKTEAAIKRFQSQYGIEADGIFGPASKKKAQAIINKYDPKKKYYSDHVIVGQACCNEFGTLSGGKAGDQTGHEVQMSNWYNGGWIYVFCAKDKDMRLKLAQAMIDTCNNQNIGYNIDKPARFAAWDNAEANGHDIKGIDKKGDTTCSQAVSMCMRAAGIPKKYAPRFCDIAVLTKVMTNDNPYFNTYTGKAYTQSSAKLQVGDILLSSHHTVIVVKGPNV